MIKILVSFFSTKLDAAGCVWLRGLTAELSMHGSAQVLQATHVCSRYLILSGLKLSKRLC